MIDNSVGSLCFGRELNFLRSYRSSIPLVRQIIIKDERKTIRMNEAQVLNASYQNSKKKIMNQSNIDALLKQITPPRTTEEVYTLGIRLQYLIGDMYLTTSNASKGQIRSLLKELALKQLERKAEIEKLAKIDLNEKLTYFYNNGGPIMLPPVTEQQAKEMYGFFIKIAANYLNQMDVVLRTAADDPESINTVDDRMNEIRVSMLTDLAKMYHQNEIRTAFKEIFHL